MMTIQQTVDIPLDHRLRLDLALPENVPSGRAKIEFTITPEQADVFDRVPQGLSSVLEKALEEAEQKRLYWKAHPDELREKLKKLQEGPPLFGGIGADEFKRRSQDEWKERI
jgi:hypothetical protein